MSTPWELGCRGSSVNSNKKRPDTMGAEAMEKKTMARNKSMDDWRKAKYKYGMLQDAVEDTAGHVRTCTAEAWSVSRQNPAIKKVEATGYARCICAMKEEQMGIDSRLWAHSDNGTVDEVWQHRPPWRSQRPRWHTWSQNVQRKCCG
jgi:hypothetical protein